MSESRAGSRGPDPQEFGGAEEDYQKPYREALESPSGNTSFTTTNFTHLGIAKGMERFFDLNPFHEILFSRLLPGHLSFCSFPASWTIPLNFLHLLSTLLTSWSPTILSLWVGFFPFLFTLPVLYSYCHAFCYNLQETVWSQLISPPGAAALKSSRSL